MEFFSPSFGSQAATKIKQYDYKMVGPGERTNNADKALKHYILRDRENQKQEDEAEAEKIRKKKEEDEKKLKLETDIKATKEKIMELMKRSEHFKSEKIRVFEYLKKVLYDSGKYRLDAEDIAKLCEIGLAMPTIPSHLPVHTSSRVPSPIIARTPTVSVNNQYKSTTTVLPVQAIPPPKRNRSPSPVYRHPYPYKQAAGPHPFQKLEDPHNRNHDYNRGSSTYLYATKPGNPPPSSSYGAFYPPGQSVPYSHPSQVLHGGAAVYSSYANRDAVDSLHKSQSPTGPSPSSSQHGSIYTHRSPAPNGPPPSIPSNHVYHPKDRAPYGEEKYYMVRPGHVSVHNVHSIQQPPQAAKHGSITSGYPVRPVATQMNPQQQIHIQSPHGGHHSSPSSHHPSLSSHHPSQSHQAHHPPGGVLYPPPHHAPPHSSSQSSHPSQPPPSSVSSHHNPAHHPQHMQQMHVSPHHPPPNSHHQLLSHHSSQSIHHSAAIHHPSHHPSSLHHQPHIQHISAHSSPSQHQPGQQSQPTSVVTSQAYVNQLSAIQAGSRVVYSQPHH